MSVNDIRGSIAVYGGRGTGKSTWMQHYVQTQNYSKVFLVSDVEKTVQDWTQVIEKDRLTCLRPSEVQDVVDKFIKLKEHEIDSTCFVIDDVNLQERKLRINLSIYAKQGFFTCLQSCQSSYDGSGQQIDFHLFARESEGVRLNHIFAKKSVTATFAKKFNQGLKTVKPYGWLVVHNQNFQFYDPPTEGQQKYLQRLIDG